MTTKASVVIPTLNGEATIGRQITSLLQQSQHIAEIIVVDNGSTDRTSDVARSFDRPELPVRLIVEPRRGANRARNAGISTATSDKVLLCDADDESLPGWAEEFSTLLDTFELAGGTVQLVTPVREAPVRILDPSTHPIIGDLRSPIGCSCALRRSTWARIGGFEPRLDGGYEEVDFFLRAQILGASVGWSHRPLLAYSFDPTRERKMRDEHYRRAHMGRVHTLAWLHGYPRRPTVMPSVLKLGFALPLMMVWPSARNRSRFRRHWSICVDRASSHVYLGLLELVRSGKASGFRRQHASAPVDLVQASQPWWDGTELQSPHSSSATPNDDSAE
jgi:glycosyltransferase involved in cell wall biosynthesis